MAFIDIEDPVKQEQIVQNNLYEKSKIYFLSSIKPESHISEKT